MVAILPRGVLVSVLFLAWPMAANANLVANPGFEELPLGTGWTFNGTGSNVGVCQTSGCANAQNGTYAGYKNSFTDGLGTISQSITTTPGFSYLVEVWLASNSAGRQDSTNMTVAFGSTIGISVSHADLQGTLQKFTFVAGATAASTDITFAGFIQSSSTMFIDDVSITAVNPDILRVDQTGSVIAYANIDDFAMNQNGMALGAPVSAFATARGFFSVADKFYAVLSDGTIVEYLTALDFANDFNGAEIGTVAEYATDVGFLGAAPIPIISAPALSHSGRAALTAVLIGAAGWLFARRRNAGVDN